MAAENIDPRTPILVGCGDVTDMRTPVEQGRSPFDLMADAGRLALEDAGGTGTTDAIDTVAVLRLFVDSSPRFAATGLGSSANPPRSIARRLGLKAGREIYTHVGGNMPQSLVNTFAQAIADGEMRAALIVGGEALRTQLGVQRAGQEVSWAEDPGGEPELLGESRSGWSPHEEKHGLDAAISYYPLFEQAIRGRRGHTVEQHLQSMARLLEGFSSVAAVNPLATRREPMAAERLARVDADNRWIGFPYPRLMNANVFVDQASALIITSVGEARASGIPESKWIYLHGCADGHDHWHVTERENLYSSPAIRAGSALALDMAGIGTDELSYLDVYSCFPSAVEIACQELGLLEDDPRGLTVTGGLPYFGGPGNNYVTHSIAEMMRRLRREPGKYGLVTANGYYLTKHAFGIYSSLPVTGPWSREEPSRLQARLDAWPKADFTETPTGRAVIETYTVMYDRKAPVQGIVFGREQDSGRRFVANTPPDGAVLQDLEDREGLGRPGSVRSMDGLNIFTPDR
ncbi:MAG: acetyl-CoA acetyltransferase [Ectothiorhodospiraceae bacterium]|nr:acetyl-CoA acetyltransferase [Ectothiorhodospiraceae bacterium]